MSVMRLAMWSCPRTVSTAMLRSFVQRTDTEGVDEPLYAHYLQATGRQHPMREEVLQAQSADWRQVVSEVLLGPCSKPVQFVKHMAHHLEGGVELEFTLHPDMVHLFLIRHPREMMPSLLKDLGKLEAMDLGYGRQVELFRFLQAHQRPLAVVDSMELLAQPGPMLRRICQYFGLPFEEAMMQWEAGRHPCYGVWAQAWYSKVEQSTGWRKAVPKTEALATELKPLYADAVVAYEELHAAALQPV